MNDRRAILRELVKGSMRDNPNLAVPEERDRADRPPTGRGALLASRILWTYSAAYRGVPRKWKAVLEAPNAS